MQCYSWSNHGNLGDDWLGEVSDQYFDTVVKVRERRSLNPFDLGGHRLARTDGSAASGRLVLWGGGWIAADRPGSRTMRAWSRHVSRQLSDLVGIGLGIGPFIDLTEQQQVSMDLFFAAFKGNLGVRTFADLEHVPSGHSAVVGCDIAILDQRFLGPSQYLGHDSSYVVFSFPVYSSHWAKTRPWMTEEWYLAHVGSLADNVGQSQRILFVEFDQVKGQTSDSAYWSHLPATTVRPQSIEEAAVIFRNARQVYAGRLHAAILGALVGNPTLAMAYHHKFEVVSELGIPTLGLRTQPNNLRKPERADPAAIRRVRERGLDTVMTVRSNG